MMESKYQTGWARFWASFIDGLIFLPLGFIEDYFLLPTENKLGMISWIIFSVILSYTYSVLLHAKYGQTLGKMAMKVKIVDQSETKSINFLQAFMRDSVGMVISLVAVIFLYFQFADVRLIEKNYDEFLMPWLISWLIIELVTMLFNQKRRAVHDFIAGTVVIRTK